MIIKNNDFKNFIESITLYTGFLIYGGDRGRVKDRSNKILEQLRAEKNMTVIKASQEDLEKTNLIDLINQKDIFSSKSIIIINIDFFSSFKLDEGFVSSLSSNDCNYLLLEAGNLNKSDLLVKAFSKSEKLACIPCYHDTEISIRKTIIDYSEKFNLKIDNDSINHLSNKLGSDTLLTIQEIKKLAIYGNGEYVSYEDVLKSIGDSSLININKICDNLFNSNKAPYIYEKIIETGYNNIVVIRSLLNHFYFLLNIKENDEENERGLPLSVHFSRHTMIKRQLKILSKDKIKRIIANIYELEKKSKKNYTLSDLLIKKFLLYYSIL